MLLENESLSEREVPILFFANKMDLQGSMDAAKVASSLELENITDRPWHI
jgi:ADP-ribosylation factor-like protein 6